MNFENKLAGEIDDPVLAEALKHFKVSVDAWSGAAYSSPRTTVVSTVRHSWRRAAGWALGCVLAAGSLAGGVYEHHHRQELARIAAMQAAAQKALQARQEAEQSAAANAAHKGSESAGDSGQRCIARGSGGNGAAGAIDGRRRGTVRGKAEA